MSQCTDCFDSIVNPIPQLQPFCEQCSEENDKCAYKFPAECVIYHIDNDLPTKLVNMGVPNKTSVSAILERIDELLRPFDYSFLNVSGSSSINVSKNLDGFRVNAIISTADNNALRINTDGLFSQQLLVSQQAGNQIVSQSDGIYVAGQDIPEQVNLDWKVKVDTNDTPGFLADKLQGGTSTGISIAEDDSNGIVSFIPTLDFAAISSQLSGNFILNQSAVIQNATFKINGGGNGLMYFNGKSLFLSDVSANINIGDRTGQESSGGSNINMGYQAFIGGNGNYEICLGTAAGHTVYGDDGIYLGRYAGMTTDGNHNIAIGFLAATNSHSNEGTFIGYNTSAGEPIIDIVIPNNHFAVNTNLITGLTSDIAASGLPIGSRIAVQLSDSSVQIGGNNMVAGGSSFKGVILDADSIQMQYQGAFTSQGTGTTRLRVIRDTTNVTVIGRNAHATKSDQVAIGDDFVNQLKIGEAIIRINGQSIGLPRLDTTTINSLPSPQGGDIAFDTTVGKVRVYSGSAWRYLVYE